MEGVDIPNAAGELFHIGSIRSARTDTAGSFLSLYLDAVTKNQETETETYHYSIAIRTPIYER